MILDATKKAILDACAQAILSGTNGGLDLFSFNSVFNRSGAGDEIVTTLAQKVEELSAGDKTVRRVDSALLHDQSKGMTLSLVLCSGDTPDDEVTELDHRMVLISFGPYSNGFEVGAKRASKDLVAKRRTQRVEAERHRQRRQAATELAEAFSLKLTEAVGRRVHEYGDVELGAEFDRQLPSSGILTLEKVAYFAAVMGVTIESLVTS